MAPSPNRIRSTWALPTVTLLVLPIPACAQSDVEVAESPARTIETITESSVRAHIEFLASDELRGRDTPSEGLETAAEYLARRHRENGLEPGGEDGTFLQRYRILMLTPQGDTVEAEPPNVLARLPGADPDLRDEYLVLSAHFDHVGVGAPIDGDSIYNGADDNGSGTAALLEVARALAELPPEQRPRRSVLFAHVSGEEKGLLGSRWWVDHPTVPIRDVVANVNIDMIAGDTHPDTVAVLGKDYSSLGPLMDGVNAEHEELGLTTVPDLWPDEGLFFRSDQYNFMREEIPALFLFAGFHECYHRPCDELDFVSPDKAARIARLVAYTVLELANRDEPPAWTEPGLTEVRRIISGGG